ncbi:MAG: radical SAM/SPASM domain-containing protein [Candidatus Buchananbacteria bacterium]
MKVNKKLVAWLMSKFNVGKIDRIVSNMPLIRIIYKLLIQKTIDYDFPTHLFIESTSACNLSCKMCPRTEGNTLIGNMDFEIFKKIIDEAKNYGPRSFCLHLFGEPLLAPNLIEMIKYIKAANLNNTILLTTNATLLTGEKARALVKYQVDKIAISFTSPDPKTYFEKTGVDKLAIVEKNINNLIMVKEENKSNNPLIFLRMIVAKDTSDQTKDFIKKWKNKKVIAELREMHNYGGNIKESNIKNQKKRYPCYHLWLSPAIHWNGDVSICCDDYARKALLGNIKNQPLYEIWNGQKISHYRKLHLQGKYNQMPICGDCDVWNIYSDLFFDWQKK